MNGSAESVAAAHERTNFPGGKNLLGVSQHNRGYGRLLFARKQLLGDGFDDLFKTIQMGCLVWGCGRPGNARSSNGPLYCNRLLSLGRYAMKGVARPQELFTVDLGQGASQ